MLVLIIVILLQIMFMILDDYEMEMGKKKNKTKYGNQYFKIHFPAHIKRKFSVASLKPWRIMAFPLQTQKALTFICRHSAARNLVEVISSMFVLKEMAPPCFHSFMNKLREINSLRAGI